MCAETSHTAYAVTDAGVLHKNEMLYFFSELGSSHDSSEATTRGVR